jgi:hypothetical protein
MSFCACASVAVALLVWIPGPQHPTHFFSHGPVIPLIGLWCGAFCNGLRTELAPMWPMAASVSIWLSHAQH